MDLNNNINYIYNFFCDYENDCENKKVLFDGNACLMCKNYKRTRLDLYKSKSNIKQSLYDSFNKNNI